MKTIIPRERVWRAIRHQEPDRVPWHLGCTVPARQRLEAFYGTTNLDDVLGNHLAKYRPRAPEGLREIRPGFFRDDFGVVWNRTVDKDIGVVDDYLLKRRSLEGYAFPDPHDPGRYEALPAFIAEHANRFRYVSVSFSLFERVEISATRFAVVVRGKDSVVAAGRIDPRFARDTDYPNRWRPLLRDEQAEIKLGAAHPLAHAGGYAKQLSEEFYRKQGILIGDRCALSDIVITTALIGGVKAPRLITAAMVARMRPGSVIVDLAAEGGGNCELTRPGTAVTEHGVRILGPTNLPSDMPWHASTLYSRNLTAFVLAFCKDGAFTLDLDDEIIRGCLVTHGGEIRRRG